MSSYYRHLSHGELGESTGIQADSSTNLHKLQGENAGNVLMSVENYVVSLLFGETNLPVILQGSYELHRLKYCLPNTSAPSLMLYLFQC